MAIVLYIVDEFKAIIERVEATLSISINYQFGEDEHVIKSMKDLNITGRYPFIGLFLPIDIQKGNAGGYYGKAVVPRIVIATTTNALKPPDIRLTTVIKPVIIPIYNEFLRQIKLQKAFAIQGDVIHTERIRFGTQTAAQGFTEYIDGMELLNIELTLKQDYC